MSVRALLLIFLIVASRGAGAAPPGGDVQPPSASALSAVTLGEADVALYRQIFTAQAKGDWAAADGLIARLDDPLLMGHVLHQRYMHPTAWRSSYAELAGWLERYADHPNADRIHALAERRRPAGARAPQPPLAGYLGGAGQDGQELVRPRWRGSSDRPAAHHQTVQAWQEAIERLVGAGDLNGALAEIERGRGALADPVEIGLSRWLVARGAFARGDDAGGLEQAEAAAASAGRAVPEVHWTAGIAAWRLGRIEVAARHFAVLAEAAGGHPNERARAAFWAARAEVALGRPKAAGHFLGLAAHQPRDFYGMLARAVLGEAAVFGWEGAGLRDNLLEALLRHDGARRAIALGQVGRADLAELEIRKLAARAEPEVLAGLIALAEALHLPATQMRLAQRLTHAAGRLPHGALYPLPLWRPEDGLRLDRALIFAVMRAESGFDPRAESHVGALGLMQVMPRTARWMAGKVQLDLPRTDALLDPATGIAFGQAYLEHLLRHPGIGDNLIFVAAAYNAGPGRVLQWQRERAAEHDPLLFLESIPMTEPRIYVKKVLTNLWSYRARLGQPNPALAALAHNQWPRYQALDEKPVIYARN
jgi:soluble lytic murein transglycosylase